MFLGRRNPSRKVLLSWVCQNTFPPGPRSVSASCQVVSAKYVDLLQITAPCSLSFTVTLRGESGKWKDKSKTPINCYHLAQSVVCILPSNISQLACSCQTSKWEIEEEIYLHFFCFCLMTPRPRPVISYERCYLANRTDGDWVGIFS